MPQWYDITRKPEYQSLTPEDQSTAKQEFFQRFILPKIDADEDLKGDEDVRKAAYYKFMQTPDDTGQGQITSTIGSAARGFGEIIPGAIQGAGALTGIKPLETAGEAVRSGLRYIAPVNPLYEDTILNKGANVVGNIGSVLATAGVGGAIGKGLAAERIAAGATAAEQALATTGAVTRGANAALYGSAGLQGAASGAQLADQYGLEGGARYANVLAGAAGEIGSEMLPFGLGSETAVAKRILGAAPQTGRVLGDIASEAGEEGINQLWQNAALKTLAPEGTETPGLTEGVLESAAYGGLGGGILAGVNVATGAYKQPANAAAAELLHAASLASPNTKLTTAATDKQIQDSVTATVSGLGEEAAAFAENLRRTQEEGEAADVQSAQMRAQEEAAQAQAAADRQAQFEGLSQNEPAITAPVGGAIPAVGQEEAAAIQPEQQLPDSLGVSEAPQLAADEPTSPEGLVGESEGVLRNRAQIANAAALNSGQIPTTPIPSVFPPVQPTVQRVAHENDTMPLKDLSAYAQSQGLPKNEAHDFARETIKGWANKIVDSANKLFGKSIKLGFFPSKISKDGLRVTASGRGLSHRNGIEVDDSQSPLHAAWVAAHEFSHQLFPSAALPKEASMAVGTHPQGLEDLKSKGKAEKLASDFANWMTRKEFPEHSDKIPSVPKELSDFFESNISPAAQKEPPLTPSGQVANEGGGPVTSNETEAGFQVQPPVETKETPQGEVSSADIESKALEILLQKRPNLSATVAAKAKKYFATGDFDIIRSLPLPLRSDIDHSIQDADPKRLHAQLAADEKQREHDRKMEEDDRKADEEMAKRQAKLTESRISAIKQTVDSIIGDKNLVEIGAVSVNDGLEAQAYLNNAGDIPGILNAFVGTSDQFLSNPENEKLHPHIYAMVRFIKAEQNAPEIDGKKKPQLAEGFFDPQTGRSILITDGVGIDPIDRRMAEQLGISPAVAAAKRVLTHEALGHRGWWGLSDKDRDSLSKVIRSMKSPEDFDRLAKYYPELADWRTNSDAESQLVQEFISKMVESMKTIPKDGPLRRLVELLQEIWQKIFGKPDKQLTFKQLRLFAQMLQAGTKAPKNQLVNGGKINIAGNRYAFSTANGRTTITLNGHKVAGPTKSNLAGFPSEGNTANQEDAYFSSRESEDQRAASDVLGEQVESTRRIERVTIPDSYKNTGLGKALVISHLQQFPNATFYNSQASPELTRAFQALARDGYISLNGEIVPGGVSFGQHAITLTEKGRTTAPNSLLKNTTPQSNPVYASRINAELARAAERFRQMNERQAVETPEGLRELFNPNAQGSGTNNKLFEQQVTPQQIRSEIRAAYDRAIQGSGSVQAPIQQVFDEAKTQIPTLTERQFGEQLQALYEDGSAFLVPADRSDAMMAAGEKWGVYDASGMPASYVGIMPLEIRASRVNGEVEAKHRKLVQEKKVNGPQVNYGGRPIQDEKGNILEPTYQTEEGYENHLSIATKIVADLIKELPSPIDLPNELNSDEYLRAIGAERNIDLQQSLFFEGERALRELASKSKDPEESHALIRASKDAGIYARQLRSGAGRALGRVGWQYKDPRYAGQILVDGLENAKAIEQDEAIAGKFTDDVDEQVSSINSDANQGANVAMEGDLEATLENAQFEEGKKSLSEKARSLLAKIHAWIADLGAVRAALATKRGNIQASNAAERQSKYAKMTIEQLEAEESNLSKKVEAALEDLADELFKTSAKKKTGKKLTKQAAKKTAEKLARPTKKEQLLKGGKMTQLQNLLNKTREGWTWPQIFALPEAGQVRRRADMLQKVKDNEAFADLTDEEKAQLVDLLDQAWHDRKATYFGQLLQRMGAKLPFASNKSVSLAVIQSVDKLLKHFNDGTFDKDAFREVLAEKFGIKPLDQENLAKAKKLAQEMQSPDISNPQWVRKADELTRLVSSGQKLSLARVLSDWWITAVLSGPRTLFAIATAFTNGLGRIIADGGTRLVMTGDVKSVSSALKRYFELWPTAFKEMGHYIVTGDKSILENSKEQLSKYMAEGLEGSNPITTSYQLLHWDKDKRPDAAAWEKTQGKIMRAMGRFMTVIERVLGGLDHFNAATTKYGYLPLAIAQNQQIYKDARLPTEAEMGLFRNQAKAELFDGREPQTLAEKTVLDSWTRQISDKHYKEFQDVIDGANYAAQLAAMTTNPEGFAGGAYRLVLGAASKGRNAADKLAREAELLKQNPNASKYDIWLATTSAASAQLAAYSAQNLLGVRFIRFVSNKFNDALTYIPIAGYLLRAGEKTNRNKTKTAIIHSNQAIGMFLGMVGWAAIKAIADEPDDEKRGWSIDGPWQNLSPEQKSQLMSSGRKANSITIGGRVLSYQGWPISAILSAIGTLTDMVKYQRDKWDEKDYGDRFFAATYVAVTSVADTAALSQLSEILGKSVNSSDPIETGVKRFSKYGSNFAGGFVPRLFKDMDSWFSEGINKYDGVYENFAKEIPWYRRNVGAPRLDIFGEQVKVSRAPWSREFPRQPTDPAYALLGKLNQRDLWLAPSDPSLRTVGMGNRRRHLNPDEQNLYMQEVSKGYKDLVMRYGQKLLTMPGDRASDFLAKKSKQVRDAAEKKSIRRLATS